MADAHLKNHLATDEVEKTLAANSPLPGRAGTALDVANAALWLGSDDCQLLFAWVHSLRSWAFSPLTLL